MKEGVEMKESKKWLGCLILLLVCFCVLSIVTVIVVKDNASYKKDILEKDKKIEELSEQKEKLENDNYRLQMMADESYELFINCVNTPKD